MFGVPNKRIMPFRLITCDRLAKADRTYFSRGKTVFNLIIQQAYEAGKITEEEEMIGSLNASEWLPIFADAFKNLLIKIKTEKMTSKPELVSYLSIYNYYSKYITSFPPS